MSGVQLSRGVGCFVYPVIYRSHNVLHIRGLRLRFFIFSFVFSPCLPFFFFAVSDPEAEMLEISHFLYVPLRGNEGIGSQVRGLHVTRHGERRTGAGGSGFALGYDRGGVVGRWRG